MSPEIPARLTALVDQLKAEIDQVSGAQLALALDAVGGVQLTEDDQMLVTVGREVGIAAALVVLDRKGWLKAPTP